MKIVTEIPGPTDGTQWYRCAGPFGRLSQTLSHFNISYHREIDWGTLKSANVLFLLRPTTSRQISYINLAKELGVKVWIDYDDYLLGVPKDNPSSLYYQNQEVQKNVELCLSLADKVSVSTTHLKKLFLKHCQAEIDVIPNAIDPSLLRHRPKRAPIGTIVLWRGTSTHQRDLMEYADAIVSVAQKDEKIKFAFVGYNPWFITERLPRQTLLFPPVDLFQFNTALCALRPKITIVPLHDSDFNRSKSNIAALEGSMAGSAILAPDWPTWDIPGLMRYDSPEKFATLLELMIAEPDLSPVSNDTWNYIEKNLLLDHVNLLRGILLEGLLS